MTLFAEALFTFLTSAGTSAGSRIYPQQLPQGVTLPAIRYQKISDPSDATMTGPSALRHPRYQLDCYADGDNAYLSAAALADQVITALDGYSGVMSGITVFASFQQDTRDNYDTETGRFWQSVDLIIWHQKV
ncbi:MAG: DUF3168 domain-containing protein [Chloroflexi bacterium]|nr:DUF3168 domain-containing protein [Chloroflexota bacterium]